MNIYDPPMIYDPIAKWVEYLEALKADGGDHSEEIKRTIETISRLLPRD